MRAANEIAIVLQVLFKALSVRKSATFSEKDWCLQCFSEILFEKDDEPKACFFPRQGDGLNQSSEVGRDQNNLGWSQC
jgi:hypothetical protein